ncbi:unnamed protein product [Closterium sp. Naga37s-1]|nr:unnamed protein product [Closterium sp. Naga37s-1]
MWHRSKKKQQNAPLLQRLTCLWQVQTSVAQGLAATSLHADGFAATADVAVGEGEGGGVGGGVGSAWGRPKGDDDGEGAEEDGEDDEEEEEDDDAVSVVDLPHPAPVLAVQWRPQDTASKPLSSSGVGATSAGGAGTGGSGSAPYHRPILLTCAEDGTVRLWMEIDSGSSRAKAGGSAGAAGSGSRAGSRLSSPKHPGSSRYGNQNENPNLEAGFGQKRRKGAERQSSEEGRWAPSPAFFVCAVVDGNMTLGGRLGMDISVLWAKEVRVGDGSKSVSVGGGGGGAAGGKGSFGVEVIQGGDVAPCEWLVGVGPRGTVVLWAVFCLDDTSPPRCPRVMMWQQATGVLQDKALNHNNHTHLQTYSNHTHPSNPTTHLISAIVQRVTGQSGSPPMAVEIAEKLPGSFMRWSRLWPPVLAIGAGGKLGGRIGGNSTDGHGATGGVGGGAAQHGSMGYSSHNSSSSSHMGNSGGAIASSRRAAWGSVSQHVHLAGHRGAITEVAVHPAPGFPLAATLDAHGNTLLWGPRAPPWLPLLTEIPEGASNEWVLLGSLPPAVPGSGGGGYERGFARLAWAPVLLPGGASVLAVAGVGSVDLYLVRRVCEGREGEHAGGNEHHGDHGGYDGDAEEERAECRWLCALTAPNASPEEASVGAAVAATAGPFLGVACLPHTPHSAAHSASSTQTSSTAAGLAGLGRGERRGVRVVGVGQGGLCVCVWAVEICIQRGEVRASVHTDGEAESRVTTTDQGKAGVGGEGGEGAEGAEGAAWEENAVSWLVGVHGAGGRGDGEEEAGEGGEHNEQAPHGLHSVPYAAAGITAVTTSTRVIRFPSSRQVTCLHCAPVNDSIWASPLKAQGASHQRGREHAAADGTGTAGSAGASGSSDLQALQEMLSRRGWLEEAGGLLAGTGASSAASGQFESGQSGSGQFGARFGLPEGKHEEGREEGSPSADDVAGIGGGGGSGTAAAGSGQDRGSVYQEWNRSGGRIQEASTGRRDSAEVAGAGGWKAPGWAGWVEVGRVELGEVGFVRCLSWAPQGLLLAGTGQQLLVISPVMRAEAAVVAVGAAGEGVGSAGSGAADVAPSAAAAGGGGGGVVRAGFTAGKAGIGFAYSREPSAADLSLSISPWISPATSHLSLTSMSHISLTDLAVVASRSGRSGAGAQARPVARVSSRLSLPLSASDPALAAAQSVLAGAGTAGTGAGAGIGSGAAGAAGAGGGGGGGRAGVLGGGRVMPYTPSAPNFGLLVSPARRDASSSGGRFTSGTGTAGGGGGAGGGSEIPDGGLGAGSEDVKVSALVRALDGSGRLLLSDAVAAVASVVPDYHPTVIWTLLNQGLLPSARACIRHLSRSLAAAQAKAHSAHSQQQNKGFFSQTCLVSSSSFTSSCVSPCVPYSQLCLPEASSSASSAPAAKAATASASSGRLSGGFGGDFGGFGGSGGGFAGFSSTGESSMGSRSGGVGGGVGGGTSARASGGGGGGGGSKQAYNPFSLVNVRSALDDSDGEEEGEEVDVGGKRGSAGAGESSKGADSGGGGGGGLGVKGSGVVPPAVLRWQQLQQRVLVGGQAPFTEAEATAIFQVLSEAGGTCSTGTSSGVGSGTRVAGVLGLTAGEAGMVVVLLDVLAAMDGVGVKEEEELQQPEGGGLSSSAVAAAASVARAVKALDEPGKRFWLALQLSRASKKHQKRRADAAAAAEKAASATTTRAGAAASSYGSSTDHRLSSSRGGSAGAGGLGQQQQQQGQGQGPQQQGQGQQEGQLELESRAVAWAVHTESVGDVVNACLDDADKPTWAGLRALGVGAAGSTPLPPVTSLSLSYHTTLFPPLSTSDAAGSKDAALHTAGPTFETSQKTSLTIPLFSRPSLHQMQQVARTLLYILLDRLLRRLKRPLLPSLPVPSLPMQISPPLCTFSSLLSVNLSPQIQMERVARAQYQQRRDPKDCALLYMVLDRRSVLHGLLKLSRDDRDKKLVDFLGRDFTVRLFRSNHCFTPDTPLPRLPHPYPLLPTASPASIPTHYSSSQEERHRAAALKNAYVLLSQHRFDLAATFFLLGEDIPSAASVCARNLNDPQLALVLCRLREDKAGAAAYSKDVIQRLLLPDAVSKGDAWMVCTLKWLMGQKLEALQVLVLSSHQNTNTPSLTRSSSSTANTASSALTPSHPATSAAEPAGAEVAAFCATVAKKPGLGEETEAVQRLAEVAAVEAVSGGDHMGLVLQSVLEITKQRGLGPVPSGAGQAQSGAGGFSGGALDFRGMGVGSGSKGALGSGEAGLSVATAMAQMAMVGKTVGAVPAVVGEGWVVPAVVAAVQAAKLRQLLKQRAAACLAAASVADGVAKRCGRDRRVGGGKGGGGSMGVFEVVEEVEAWAKHCASDYTAALAAISSQAVTASQPFTLCHVTAHMAQWAIPRPLPRPDAISTVHPPHPVEDLRAQLCMAILRRVAVSLPPALSRVVMGRGAVGGGRWRVKRVCCGPGETSYLSQHHQQQQSQQQQQQQQSQQQQERKQRLLNHYLDEGLGVDALRLVHVAGEILQMWREGAAAMRAASAAAAAHSSSASASASASASTAASARHHPSSPSFTPPTSPIPPHMALDEAETLLEQKIEAEGRVVAALALICFVTAAWMSHRPLTLARLLEPVVRERGGERGWRGVGEGGLGERTGGNGEGERVGRSVGGRVGAGGVGGAPVLPGEGEDCLHWFLGLERNGRGAEGGEGGDGEQGLGLVHRGGGVNNGAGGERKADKEKEVGLGAGESGGRDEEGRFIGPGRAVVEGQVVVLSEDDMWRVVGASVWSLVERYVRKQAVPPSLISRAFQSFGWMSPVQSYLQNQQQQQQQQPQQPQHLQQQQQQQQGRLFGQPSHSQQQQGGQQGGQQGQGARSPMQAPPAHPHHPSHLLPQHHNHNQQQQQQHWQPPHHFVPYSPPQSGTTTPTLSTPPLSPHLHPHALLSPDQHQHQLLQQQQYHHHHHQQQQPPPAPSSFFSAFSRPWTSPASPAPSSSSSLLSPAPSSTPSPAPSYLKPTGAAGGGMAGAASAAAAAAVAAAAQAADRAAGGGKQRAGAGAGSGGGRGGSREAAADPAHLFPQALLPDACAATAASDALVLASARVASALRRQLAAHVSTRMHVREGAASGVQGVGTTTKGNTRTTRNTQVAAGGSGGAGGGATDGGSKEEAVCAYARLASLAVEDGLLQWLADEHSLHHNHLHGGQHVQQHGQYMSRHHGNIPSHPDAHAHGATAAHAAHGVHGVSTNSHSPFPPSTHPGTASAAATAPREAGIAPGTTAGGIAGGMAGGLAAGMSLSSVAPTGLESCPLLPDVPHTVLESPESGPVLVLAAAADVSYIEAASNGVEGPGGASGAAAAAGKAGGRLEGGRPGVGGTTRGPSVLGKSGLGSTGVGGARAGGGGKDEGKEGRGGVGGKGGKGVGEGGACDLGEWGRALIGLIGREKEVEGGGGKWGSAGGSMGDVREQAMKGGMSEGEQGGRVKGGAGEEPGDSKSGEGGEGGERGEEEEEAGVRWAKTALGEPLEVLKTGGELLEGVCVNALNPRQAVVATNRKGVLFFDIHSASASHSSSSSGHLSASAASSGYPGYPGASGYGSHAAAAGLGSAVFDSLWASACWPADSYAGRVATPPLAHFALLTHSPSGRMNLPGSAGGGGWGGGAGQSGESMGSSGAGSMGSGGGVGRLGGFGSSSFNSASISNNPANTSSPFSPIGSAVVRGTAARDSSYAGGVGMGIPGYGGIGAWGLGWEDLEDAEEGYVDPPATAESVAGRALAAHPLRPFFLVGSTNTHVYLWQVGRSGNCVGGLVHQQQQLRTSAARCQHACAAGLPLRHCSLSLLCYGECFATAAAAAPGRKALASPPSPSVFPSPYAFFPLPQFGAPAATATYGVLPAANTPVPLVIPSVTALSLHRYGERFATAAADGTVSMWQLEVGGRSNVKPTETKHCFGRSASGVAFIGASSSVLAAVGQSPSQDNLVVWDSLAPPNASRVAINCHQGGATSIAIVDNTIPAAATGSTGGGAAAARGVAGGGTGGGGGGQLSASHSLIVTGGKGGDISVHDFRAHSSSVSAILSLPGTPLFLSAGKDGEVKLWDASRCRLLREWPRRCDGYDSLNPWHSHVVTVNVVVFYSTHSFYPFSYPSFPSPILFPDLPLILNSRSLANSAPHRRALHRAISRAAASGTVCAVLEKMDIPGDTQPIEFRNWRTSLASVLVHAVVFFILLLLIDEYYFSSAAGGGGGGKHD